MTPLPDANDAPNSTSIPGRTREPTANKDLVSGKIIEPAGFDKRIIPPPHVPARTWLYQKIGDVIAEAGKFYHADAGDFQSRAQAETQIRELKTIREALQHSQKQWFASTANGAFSGTGGNYVHVREGVPGARHRIEGIHIDSPGGATNLPFQLQLFAGNDPNVATGALSGKLQFQTFLRNWSSAYGIIRDTSSSHAVGLNGTGVKSSYTFPAAQTNSSQGTGRLVGVDIAVSEGSATTNAATVFLLERVHGGVTDVIGDSFLITAAGVGQTANWDNVRGVPAILGLPKQGILGDVFQLKVPNAGSTVGTVDITWYVELDTLPSGLVWDMATPIDFGPGNGITVYFSGGPANVNIDVWGQTVSTLEAGDVS